MPRANIWPAELYPQYENRAAGRYFFRRKPLRAK